MLQSVKTSENNTQQRKSKHIHAALHSHVEYSKVSAGFDKWTFEYNALPEMNRHNVDTSCKLLGMDLKMPLLISAMTGGTDEAYEYNCRFAKAAQQFGLAMGVGSQRAAIENPAVAYTYNVKEVAPDIVLFANLGAVQLNNGCGIKACKKAVEMINADALVLHINPLQECIQPGGNTNFENLYSKISRVVEMIDVPVIVKEVGHGISGENAKRLVECGVTCIDSAGAGGTSWAKLEATLLDDPAIRESALRLSEWGIPTTECITQIRESAPNIEIIASGGVRSGEDIAKSIALGANAAGIALPLMKAAYISYDALENAIELLRQELITVMFCNGSKNIDELKNKAVIKTT
jgi:isopentenyl-diphosphate delta-isomerase